MSGARFGEILPDLESAVRLIRAREIASGSAALDRVSRFLEGRALDPGDRMILGKVLGRLRKACLEIADGPRLLQRFESFSVVGAC